MSAGEARAVRGGPNTPGVAGYLLAWAVSCLLLLGGCAWLALLDSSSDQPVADALAVAVLGAVYVPVSSLPFAVVGVASVHLLCRRVRPQRVHVLAAGVAGLLPLTLIRLLAGEWLWAWALVGVCTALGRLAVVPLVGRRRDSARAAARG